MAEVKAKLRYLRVSPRKVRRVVDTIRGRKVEEALDILNFTTMASAPDLSKLIRSALANAGQRGGMDVDQLYLKSIWVSVGPIIKRYLARARGSASRINKRTSHITVVLDEKQLTKSS